MGAICSGGKNSTVVDSHHNARDQTDSGEQKYANHDVPKPAIKHPNTNTRQGVDYISASETSLQKESNSPADKLDNTMPTRLQEAAAGSAMNAATTEIKSDNSHLQATFGSMERAKQLFVSEMEKENSETYFDPILKVLKQEFSGTFEKFSSSTDRLAIGEFMAKIGLVDTLVRLYSYVMEDMFEAFTLATLKDEGIEKSLLREIRKILWNFSDLSPEFQVAIAKPRLLFGFLAKDLQVMKKLEFDLIKESSFPFKSAVNIIHNCSRSANVTKDMFTVELQPEGGDVEVSLKKCLTPFLQSSDTYVKLITLLSLAHIMDDNENKELLGADRSLLDFLLDMIKEATKPEDRRHKGFSVEELLDGLSRLAKNDINKGNIMNIPDAYTLIKGIIARGDASETIAAVRTIWELAFDENNRIIVQNDTEFVKQLKDLKHSKTKELAEVASYACFVIDDDDEDTNSDDEELKHNITDSMVPQIGAEISGPSERKKKKEKKPSEVSPPSSANKNCSAFQEKPRHIMISYNWSHKPVLLKVYDSLKNAGFPLWMDVYNMKGNVLDAMSQAVIDAEIVVICASEQYGNSLNCRTEAEFARKKKKIIIPFMMQKDSTTWLPPWLDMLLGEKLWYPFYNVELDNQPAFEKRMKEVIKALRDHMNPGQPGVPRTLPALLPDTQTKTSQKTTLKQSTPSEETTATSKTNKSKQPKTTNSQIASQLDSWTEDDIETWLKDNRLHTYAGMKAITCEQLQFLVKISVKAPEFFYRSLKEEVGLKGLEQLMRVSNAIEKLV